MTTRKNDNEKKKCGRKTTYQEAFANHALKLCLLGATDSEMADFFGISEQTLNSWKKKFPEFLESLKKGKSVADANVASKLYNRATGYDAKATKFATNEGKITDRVEYIEHYPPDTTAAIFWLKNRQPQLWRDKKEIETSVKLGDELESLTDEELRAIIRGEIESKGITDTPSESSNDIEKTGSPE